LGKRGTKLVKFQHGLGGAHGTNDDFQFPVRRCEELAGGFECEKG
jgi:hypothetical protein